MRNCITVTHYNSHRVAIDLHRGGHRSLPTIRHPSADWIRTALGTVTFLFEIFEKVTVRAHLFIIRKL